MRARLLFVMMAVVGGTAISAVTACSSPDVAVEGDAKATTQASSVRVTMFDASGNDMGACTGTLVAKDLVLTAGHCAAGAVSWKVASGDQTSQSTRAVTPWKAFGSKLSHPDHSDVALLVLKTPIELDKYPSIATSKVADGAKALRFQHKSATAKGASSDSIKLTSATTKGFRLEYLAKVTKGEYLDTGGAITDTDGNIVGVVSGMGDTTGMLHIARVDNFAKWISEALSCGGGSTGLSTRTYGTSGSSGGSSSGGYGSSGGSSGSSGWGGSSGDWGGYGGQGNRIEAGAPSGGYGSKDGGSSTGPGTPDSGKPGSPGGPGGPGGGTAGDDSSDSTCPPPPSCSGGDCPGKKGGTPGSDSPGDDSSDSDTPSGSTPGGSTPGGSKPGTDVCPGPPNCPEPDTQNCTGPSCGGCAGIIGCSDATIDYGSCASCGTQNKTGTDPVVR